MRLFVGNRPLPIIRSPDLALCMTATTLGTSNSCLGAQFRRLNAGWTLVAIKALARQLARLIYRMLRYGMQSVDQGADYEAAHCQRSRPASDFNSFRLQHPRPRLADTRHNTERSLSTFWKEGDMSYLFAIGEITTFIQATAS